MVHWYQQKIGTYDKQKWETTIEQREQTMYGLTHIQTRSAKPNMDLIDLDLVRGSSFTKAKPQHGFIKVVKLATLRCIFYPFYGKWWIEQTSSYVFLISLFVYISQIFNIIVYFKHLSLNSICSESISYLEIVVPFIMMWILSLIHSQIVATSPGFEPKKSRHKQRQCRKKRSILKKTSKVEEVCSSKTNMEKKKYIIRQSANLVKQGLELHCKRLPQNNRNMFDEGFESLTNSRIYDGSFQNNSGINQNNKTTDENFEPVFGREFQHNFEPKSVDELCNYNFCEAIGKENNEPLVKRIRKTNLCSTDSESEVESIFQTNKKVLNIRHSVRIPTINITTAVNNPYDSDDEMLSSSENRHSCPLLGDVSSATEWMGVTTNSEDCSYSSDIDNISDSNIEHNNDHMAFDSDFAPTAILNPPALKVSCVIWERNEIKKADLSMLDISSAIIGRVDLMPESMDYFYFGIVLATILAFLPIICKFCNRVSDNGFSDTQDIVKELYKNLTQVVTAAVDHRLVLESYRNVIIQMPSIITKYIYSTLGISTWELFILVTASLQRWILACMIFFLLCVAERTFKQRLLYAKLFSHLTSSRRARKSELPHFRLNKVRNIKTWLSVRSYLKKRGPQRSVDVIVSTAFIANLLLLIFICVELLKDTVIFSQYYLETLIWCLGLGTLLLRFMTLGTKINKKYRNLSVLITEQINLHLQIEQKPHKKDEFTVANNVLKLAIDLLKELENPFKISGLAANPILYNVTKLIILSALSGVLSEMLGFKLKLHKIKLK